MNESDWIELPEIHLEHTMPGWFRIGVFGPAFFVVVWQFCALIMEGSTRFRGHNVNSIVTILFCSAIIACALLARNVHWTIRKEEILIDQGWIHEHRKIVLIKPGDLTKVRVWTVGDDEDPEQAPASYYLQLWLASGDDFESPSIKNKQFAHQLGDEIKRRLNVPIEEEQLS